MYYFYILFSSLSLIVSTLASQGGMRLTAVHKAALWEFGGCQITIVNHNFGLFQWIHCAFTCLLLGTQESLELALGKQFCWSGDHREPKVLNDDLVS